MQTKTFDGIVEPRQPTVRAASLSLRCGTGPRTESRLHQLSSTGRSWRLSGAWVNPKKSNIQKLSHPQATCRQKKIVAVDGIRWPVPLGRETLLSSSKRLTLGEWLSRYTTWFRKISYARLPVLLTFFLIFAAFVIGAWVSLQTRQTGAEEVFEVPNITHYYIPLPEGPKSLGPIDTVSNEVLFNLPLEQLEIYLNNLAKTPQTQEAQNLAERKMKLKQFLREKKSPFAEVSDLIAEQKHWKLILAISFAESTLGRNCPNNNCSGIGVKPGHPYWRKYASLKEWVVDFNRLLEKKYKDWTLEEMNGVYVQPKNPNWLLATRQIFTQLQEKGIE